MGRVREGPKVGQQPTLQERGIFIEIDDRAGGTRVVTQSPYKFSDAASGIQGPAPYQGEHNLEVLEDWIGANQAKVDELRQNGVLLTTEKADYEY